MNTFMFHTNSHLLLFLSIEMAEAARLVIKFIVEMIVQLTKVAKWSIGIGAGIVVFDQCIYDGRN